MSESKTKILINDACVFFDLIDLDLVDAFFSMDYDFFTSIHVLNEFLYEPQKELIVKYIETGELIIDNCSDISDTINLFENFPVLSYSDCSLLELAMRMEAILITSDKSLRNIAAKYSVKVIGTLGVIKKLVSERIITNEEAINKLYEYLKINDRAPVDQTKKMIIELEKFNISQL